MKAELQNKLFERYPKIFRQKDLPKNQTAMCCGDGWYTLLDCLCGSIQRICDKGEQTYIYYPRPVRFICRLLGNTKLIGRWKTKGVNQVEAIQVKEKFAGLRFYYIGGNDIISELVTFVEKLSQYTCEVCGTTKNANVKGQAWLKTLCDTCEGRI